MPSSSGCLCSSRCAAALPPALACLPAQPPAAPLHQIQREAMFQMEKDALQEQQEAMQKSVQDQLAKGMMGGLLGGSSEEPKAEK